MKHIIAYCGLNCHECDAYLATLANDNAKRKEVAKQWSKEYHVDLKPADINCTGCLTVGENVFSHCKVCEIRLCGIEKKVVNCAHCNDFVCEKLEKFFTMAPSLREKLTKLRTVL
ncbi:MAG: DUF3795 domain-containing protein [Candidatus Marinimicrobia bacterium]|nr:DUF3795 domain-containing protein [Candidatus Neomarinimicrobiota bacterium]